MLDYTKEELLSLIQKDPEKFNEWKIGQEDIDLSETDFSGIVLREIDFTDVDLNSSSFADSELVLVNFTGADLTSADFTRSVVEECDFTDALLTGADCSYAQMTYCNFTNADMARAILSESVLTSSDLTGCENLASARYDEDTVWPEEDLMPPDFESEYSHDLSALKDEDDDSAPVSDGEY